MMILKEQKMSFINEFSDIMAIISDPTAEIMINTSNKDHKFPLKC